MLPLYTMQEGSKYVEESKKRFQCVKRCFVEEKNKPISNSGFELKLVYCEENCMPPTLFASDTFVFLQCDSTSQTILASHSIIIRSLASHEHRMHLAFQMKCLTYPHAAVGIIYRSCTV